MDPVSLLHFLTGFLNPRPIEGASHSRANSHDLSLRSAVNTASLATSLYFVPKV